MLKERHLNRIFNHSETSDAWVRALYGYVLKSAGFSPKGVVELPKFYCASDTWNLIDGMADIWEESKNIKLKGNTWATYGFHIDESLPPLVVQFDGLGVDHA